MTTISESEALAIARPFGEAAASIVLALGSRLTAEPMDEIERQLDALIDGAPLMVSELDLPRIRALARETAGNAIIDTLQATRCERLFCVETHDHVDRIVRLVGKRVAA